MNGVVARIDGDFYTITLSPCASIVAHYSELCAPQVSSSRTRYLKHWLVGKDVMVVRDSPWKGLHGEVKDVSFPATTINEPNSPANAVDLPTDDFDRDETGIALVQISSHSIFHANTTQSIPIRNLAFDFTTAS